MIYKEKIYKKLEKGFYIYYKSNLNSTQFL